MPRLPKTNVGRLLGCIGPSSTTRSLHLKRSRLPRITASSDGDPTSSSESKSTLTLTDGSMPLARKASNAASSIRIGALSSDDERANGPHSGSIAVPYRSSIGSGSQRPFDPLRFKTGFHGLSWAHSDGFTGWPSRCALLGQHPHFMNGEQPDADAIRQYETAINE